MQYFPTNEEFQSLAESGKMVPVYRRLLSDSLTPVSAFQKLDDGANACLFESVIGGEKVGRYSFLAVDPFLQIRASGNQVTIENLGDPDSQVDSFESDNPLDDLRRLITRYQAIHLDELSLIHI